MFRAILSLVGFLAVCFAAAGLGVLAGSGRSEWLDHLAKPSWNPPSWVFGPVWTTLYTMMALATFLVWRRSGQAAITLPLVIFFVQLALNAAWSPVFFGLHNIPLSVAIIILLWLAIVLATVLFWRVSLAAGLLFLPYLAWVSFATVLNIAIWRLNS